jgi:hypothetical protein
MGQMVGLQVSGLLDQLLGMLAANEIGTMAQRLSCVSLCS